MTYKQVQGNSFQLLSFRATEIRKNDSTVKLVSIQDIRQELESRELESYRKLISVLTHEIMNLMSPLTSVSKALYGLYYKGDKAVELADVDDQTLKSTLNGLRVFDEQTDAILSFVENYRRISRIPRPVLKSFNLDEWIEQLKIVYAVKMSELGINMNIRCEPVQSELLADKNLLNQVMFNLINNATDAVMENRGERWISIYLSQSSPGRFQVMVSNNGPLIPPEVQDKIFIPFFTTKKHGSGIGLSICQEIMKLHRGSLTMISSPKSLTSFILEL